MRTLSPALVLICLVATVESTVLSSNKSLDSAFHDYFKVPKAKHARGLLLVSKGKSKTQFIFQMDGKAPTFLEIKATILSSRKLLSERSVSASADLFTEWKVFAVAVWHFAGQPLTYTIEPYRGKAPGRALSFKLPRDGAVNWLPTE